MDSEIHLAELVVDLGAIAHNVQELVAAATPAEVMAVVKADGYNHGLREVVDTVIAAGATHLGVATVGEALAVRAAGGAGATAPVTAWMWFPGEDLSAALAQNITIGIPSLAHAESLIEQAGSGAGPVPATLMVDTGLSRSGVSPAEWESTVELLAQHTDLVDVRGLMSHLATADTPNADPATDMQAQRFHRAIEFCRARGLDVPCNHLANTPATLTRPDTHHEMVRPGVGIYGVDPVEPKAGATFRPAMTFRARVITTRVVAAGEAVSYGHTWRAEVDTRTAVVAVGYADGIPRSASGRFEVSINGRRYPQIGRVCMDQVVVSLGPVSENPTESPVRPGDWAIIFGQDGPSVDEFAAAAGTIAYEILTLPRGPRVKRRFLQFDATTHSQPHNAAVTPAPAALDLSQDSGSAVAPDADAMRDLGRQVGEQLLNQETAGGAAGTVVVLTGPLGAGKTTLTQGIAQGLGVRGRVQSPTFTIVRTHKGTEGRPGMLHMDAYRLLGADVQEGIAPGEQMDRNVVLDALESLDLDADLGSHVVVAEWGRGVVEFLSDSVLDVSIERAESEDSEERVVAWSWSSRRPHEPAQDGK